MVNGGESRLAILVSPHPDDEVLGAGATVALLLKHGWLVYNLACSLGRSDDRLRRLGELTDASGRLGFTTIPMEPLAAISEGDDLEAAANDVAEALLSLIDELGGADVVISPHTHDAHHGHETVAHGVRKALEMLPTGPAWWQYGIWHDLPRPTMYVPYGHSVMSQVLDAIEAYSGENERSAYDRMYPARAEAFRTLGSERVFGFGSTTSSALPFADLITELRFDGKNWLIAVPRTFSDMDPRDVSWQPEDATWWVRSPSLRDLRTGSGSRS